MLMYAVRLKGSRAPNYLAYSGFNSYVNKYDHLTQTHPRLFHTVEETRLTMRLFKVPFNRFEVVPMNVTATRASDRVVFG